MMGGGGGGQPIPAGLYNPNPVIGYANVHCFDNYKWICSTKYRYCLVVYKYPFLEIHPYAGGGGGHIPAGLLYPQPKILEQ